MVKITLNNAWLSGFTDAEGCFICSVISSKQGNTVVTVRYILSQKDDIEFSNYVACLLNGYVTHIKIYNGYSMLVNKSNLGKIIRYINSYPLKTRKLIFFLSD